MYIKIIIILYIIIIPNKSQVSIHIDQLPFSQGFIKKGKMKVAWVVCLLALTGLASVISSPIELEIEIKKDGPYPERHGNSFGKSASRGRTKNIIQYSIGTYDIPATHGTMQFGLPGLQVQGIMGAIEGVIQRFLNGGMGGDNGIGGGGYPTTQAGVQVSGGYPTPQAGAQGGDWGSIPIGLLDYFISFSMIYFIQGILVREAISVRTLKLSVHHLTVCAWKRTLPTWVTILFRCASSIPLSLIIF